MDSRRYSFVILGATGVTGRSALEYIPARIGGAVDWAIAGRNRQALEALADQFPRGRSPAVIECDARDYESAANLARQTAVIGNLAGPYGKIGDSVVRACVAQGTDYIDICGEVDVIAGWVRDYHAAARSRSVKVIVAAGFESLIFDVATRAAVEALGEPDGRPVSVDALLSLSDMPSTRMDSLLSSGTLATFIDTLERRVPLEVLFDPYCLTPVHPDVAVQTSNRVRLNSRYDANRKVWCAPLVPGPFLNRAVVHRTNHLLTEVGRGYGPGFTYDEALNVSSRTPWPVGQPYAAEAIAAWTRAFVAALANESERENMLSVLRRYVTGRVDAPLARLDETGYQLDVVATRNDKSVNVQFVGSGDPGGRATANLFGEALLALAGDEDRSEISGVLTPAVGLGVGLLSGLRDVGISMRSAQRRVVAPGGTVDS